MPILGNDQVPLRRCHHSIFFYAETPCLSLAVGMTSFNATLVLREVRADEKGRS